MATVTNIAEKRVTWHFLIDDAEHWHWEKAHPTGSVEWSERAFGSLDQCAQDASEHGYGTWTNDERRYVPRRYDALVAVD